MDIERKGLQVIIGLLFFIGITLAGVADRFKSCKCTDESLCWPSPREWREFNASIDGALLSPLPPSYHCHIPYYNSTECDRVAQVYENRYWREDHPVAMQQPHTELDVVTNKGCIGVDNKYSFCHLRGNLPNYVVNVTTLDQIQKALKFATDNNLRFTVKNTGHDFQGRSTAKGGLSIWLHHLRTVEFVDSYEPAGCSECSGQSAVILGPGVQLGPVMQDANARGLVVASGACPSIGLAGGWIQGGGHGMLGPSVGMGVDTVLQYKVITADGKIRIANKCQNRDLFWALRGGGGGTYAVVVETVLKTYPSPAIVGAIITFQANSTESFRGLIRRFVEEMPRWSDNEWAGYFYIIASRTLRFVCMNPTSNVTYAQSTLAPFISYVTSTPGLSYSTQLFSAFPSFYPFWRTVSASHDITIYGNMVLGSWLVPRANHEGEENIERLADGYIDIVAQNQNGYAFVMLVAGGAVSAKAGCETSLLPAWRTALTHSVVTANMPYNVTLAQRTEIESSITAQVQVLRDLAPESGAYTNEADANEPDWQRAFFGEHYDQLLEIKKLYDPNELFLCPRCVGSEGRTKDLNCKL